MSPLSFPTADHCGCGCAEGCQEIVKPRQGQTLYSYVGTRTDTGTQSHTHRATHRHTPICTQSHMHTQTHIQIRTQMHTGTHTQTCKDMHRHTGILTHTDTHIHRYTQTDTDFSLYLSLSLSWKVLWGKGPLLSGSVPISTSGRLAPLPCGKRTAAAGLLSGPDHHSAVALKADMQARFFSPGNDFLNILSLDLWYSSNQRCWAREEDDIVRGWAA